MTEITNKKEATDLMTKTRRFFWQDSSQKKETFPADNQGSPLNK